MPNATFQGLASLVFLSLQGNKLRYVRETFEPRVFQGLISLESLHLEGNQPDLVEDFTYPDQAVAQVPTLRHLWMDGFPRALGPGFSSLVQLSSINLSGHGGYCSMKSDISSSFFCHLATEHPYGVNMSVCDISGIPRDVFKCVPTKDSLDLYYNKRLFIDGFEKASEGLNNSRLSVLNISKTVQPFTPVSVVKNTTFRHLKNTTLKVLLVESCKLVYIDPQPILDLPKTLEYISFRRNYLILPFCVFTALTLVNLKVMRISNQIGPKDVIDYALHQNSASQMSGHIGRMPSEMKNESVQMVRRLSGTLNSSLALSDSFQHFFNSNSSIPLKSNMRIPSYKKLVSHTYPSAGKVGKTLCRFSHSRAST